MLRIVLELREAPYMQLCDQDADSDRNIWRSQKSGGRDGTVSYKKPAASRTLVLYQRRAIHDLPQRRRVRTVDHRPI